MRRRPLLALATLALVSSCGGDSTPRAVPPANTAIHPAPAASVAPPSAPSADLSSLSLEELQHVRATIFGRHGRVFQDSALQAWLASRPWYRPDTSFSNERLSQAERDTLDAVREAEAARHAHIEPGDVRFYQNRVITSAMLGTHTPQDWEVLKAEVLANHGYVFESDETDDDEAASAMSFEALQHYFDDRYWYRRDPEFSASSLTALERQNLDTITVALTRQLGRAVSPGMMYLFAQTPLTERSLEHVSIADLRLLRNEVYARHGREFKNEWVRHRMAQEPWYKPRPDFAEAELSGVERANIALITRREAALHDELASRALTVPELMGLPPDDARRLRNEIYARHGRRFKDAGLQRYFASFSWYRPNDAFRESDLNATERKNVDLIAQYESGRFSEG
jgi:hypothetical protein